VQPVEIQDPTDPRVADYVGLRDAELRRPDRGWFIAEGMLVIRQLLRSPYPVRSVLLAPRRFATLAAELEGVEAPVYVAAPAVLNAVAGFDIHRGALASADRVPTPGYRELLAGARMVVVLEAINDHENLGAIFRNAAAFGADAVLLCPRCCDPLYRRSVRVSMGQVLHVPFARVPSWPDDLAALGADGWRVVALTPDPSARPLASVARLAPQERVAILLGAEDVGLSAAAVGVAGERVRIPMVAGVDSLNVASASAIAFHHLGLPMPGD
jgi:tRNA G18 (ribose-2'-O)-methylase SpoU